MILAAIGILAGVCLLLFFAFFFMVIVTMWQERIWWE